MRVDELHLMAFGPFTDKMLDFSQGRQGLHLVYGSNEAGKSSALRALRCLLYGIPTRTRDDFVHPYAKMRVGATIRSADGDVLKLIRRKGRGPTLRGPDDASVVEESRLSQLLKGIDEDLFATMFGIGYEDLVRGGQEILQGGGNLGQLIFSAGSGIANLREIQNELQEAANALFRPSAQKPVINDMLLRYKERQTALREAQLPGQAWESHHLALQQALERKTRVEAELASRQKAHSRLKRIQEALPIMARRSELQEALAAMGSVPELAEDFSEKRRELMTELSIAEKEQAGAAAAISHHEKATAALTVSLPVLEHAEVIEALYQDLGSQRKAARDCIQLETRRDTLRGEALETLRTLKKEVSIEEAETLRIKKDQVVLIQELSGQYERIITRLEDIREKLPVLHREIELIDTALGELPPPLNTDALQALLSEAEGYGLLENRSRNEQAEIEAALRSLANEQKRLGLENRHLEALESLAVPSTETLRLFEDRFVSLQQAVQDIEKETERTRELLQDNERQMEAHCLEQEIPSEAALIRLRGMRDRGIGLMVRKLNGEAVPAAEIDAYLREVPEAESLVDAVTFQIKQADEISDRLRREADRVAHHARLLSERKTYLAKQVQLEEMKTSCSAEEQAFAEEWTRLWQEAGVRPRSPREMFPWLQAFKTMVQKIGELRSRRSAADRLQQDITLHRQNLLRLLQPLPDVSAAADASLARLLAQAGRIVEDQRRLSQNRSDLLRDKAQLEKELAATTLRLESSEKNLGLWQTKWEQAVKPIGLMAGAMPAQAVAVLEDLKALFDRIREADILQKRIHGIQRDEAVFSERVAQLAAGVAADLVNASAEETVLELQQRLKQFRDARTRQQTLEKQMEKEQRRLLQAGEKIASIEAVLRRMCAEAACQDPAALPEIEAQSKRRRTLATELEHTEDRLRQISGGVTVEAFIIEAGQADPDALAGELQLLLEKIEVLSGEKSALDQSIGRERNELEKMDGSARAASIAEELQFLGGGIAHAAEQYASLKIAEKVLSMAIERYRDKSQGPILEKTSRLFEQMTLGSFTALRAEYDSGGQPVLVGVRQGTGERVDVAGMSDGTADQLYLALRLAGLESYLENNEPIPFVVDDILISFDNARAAAALNVLAKLSENLQIIFFTHHRHLVEIAAASVDASLLFQHNLDANGR